MRRPRVWLSLVLAASLAAAAGCKERARPAAESEQPAGRGHKQTPTDPCARRAIGDFRLDGLTSVAVADPRIVTLGEIDAAELAGVTAEQLKTFAELYVEGRGVEIDPGANSMAQGRPTLEVVLTLAPPTIPSTDGKPHVPFRLEVKVHRKIVIDGFDCWCMAPVWEQSLATTWLREDLATGVKNTLTTLLALFCWDVLPRGDAATDDRR